MDRRWPWHHFGSYHRWDWIDLLTQNLEIHRVVEKPIRTSPGAFLAGAFFIRKTRPWNFGTYCCDIQDFWNHQKRHGESQEPGYPKYEPVMFDMDPFGGKKVRCTKYPKSGFEQWCFRATWQTNNSQCQGSVKQKREYGKAIAMQSPECFTKRCDLIFDGHRHRSNDNIKLFRMTPLSISTPK